MKRNILIVGVVLLLSNRYMIAIGPECALSTQNQYSISSAAEGDRAALIKIEKVPVIGGVEINPSPDQTKYLSGISALSIVCLTIVACMRPDLIYCLLHAPTETK